MPSVRLSWNSWDMPSASSGGNGTHSALLRINPMLAVIQEGRRSPMRGRKIIDDPIFSVISLAGFGR